MIISLKKIYRTITGYFKNKKFQKINTILQEKVDEIEVDKIILKGRIEKGGALFKCGCQFKIHSKKYR